MNPLKMRGNLARFALMLACSSAGVAMAQAPDNAALLKPGPDSWPLYHGDYTGQRHTRLAQITPQNVKGLTLAWAFQTGIQGELKSSPLLIEGVL